MEVMDSPNSITFNGKNSLDFGLYVSGDKTFNSPEKDYTKVSVPGRSGDLIIFNDRYKNTNVVYNAVLIEDYFENTEKIREWLLSPNGYCRLEDTYHPDEFRLACFSGPIDFDTVLLEAGSVTLTFDCKPQRFLKSAENVYDYTYNTDLNDTHLIYEPVTGSSAPLYVANMYYKKEIVPHYYDVDEIHLAYTDEEYILLTDTNQPFDWTYNYNSYYIAREEVMINNPSAQISKPLIKVSVNGLRWKPNKYYKKLKYFASINTTPEDWDETYNNYYIPNMRKVPKQLVVPDFNSGVWYVRQKYYKDSSLTTLPSFWSLGSDFYNNTEDFNEESTYSLNDIVKYSGYYYKCKTPIETAGSWDDSNWDKVGVVDNSSGYLNYSKPHSSISNLYISNEYKEITSARSFAPNVYYTVELLWGSIIQGGKNAYKLLSEKPDWWDDNNLSQDHAILIKNNEVVLWEPNTYYDCFESFVGLESEPSNWSSTYYNCYYMDGYKKIPLQYPFPTWMSCAYYVRISLLNQSPYGIYSYDDGAETFSSSKTYSVGDYVKRTSQYFRCVTEVSTAGEWDISKWERLGFEPYDLTLVIPKGWSSNSSDYYLLSDEKAIGSNLYDSTKTYSVGDYVKHYGNYYKCIEEIDTAGSFDVNKWDRIGYTKIDPNSTYDYELAIGTGLITLKSVKIGDSFFVDCENQECYDGHYIGQSVTVINLPWLKYFVDRDPFYYKNEKLIVTKWPTLVSGDNVIKEIDTNDICCTIQINPRWWKL